MAAHSTPLNALSRSQLLDVVKATGDLLFVLDSAHRFVDVNGVACDRTGYRRQDLLAQKLSLLFPPRARALHSATIFSVLKKSGRWSGELEFRRKDGSTFPLSASAMLGSGGSNGPSFCLLVGQDLTHQRQVDHQSWKSERQLRAVVDSMSDGLLVCREEGTVLMGNRAISEMLGLAEGEVTGARPPYRWMDPAAMLSFRQGMKTFLKEGTLRNYPLALRRRDGTAMVASLAFAPLRDAEGARSGVVVTVRDVSHVHYVDDLRRAQDQIQRLVVDVKRKAERLKTLQITNTLVLRHADLVEIFRAVTAGVGKLVQHDLAGIYVFDPEKKSFKAHTLSKQTAFSRKLARFPLPLGEGIIGAAAISGKTICVNNAQQDPRSRYPERMKPELEHVIAVPLRGRESIFGVFVVARNRDPLFIEEETQIVQSFADAATVALENARLVFELQNVRDDVAGAPSVPVRARSPRLAKRSARNATKQPSTERREAR